MTGKKTRHAVLDAASLPHKFISPRGLANLSLLAYLSSIGSRPAPSGVFTTQSRFTPSPYGLATRARLIPGDLQAEARSQLKPRIPRACGAGE